jgi:two-component system cell cycle sensor histidine kinase/response regulator CckA
MPNQRRAQERDALRERAERIAAELPPSRATKDVKSLLYELQLHDLELAAQCEELRETQLELERSRESYRELYDEAPVAYLTCTPSGRIERANPCLAELLGTTLTDLVGTAFPRFATAEHRDTFYQHARRLEHEPAASCQMQLITAEGEFRDVRLDSRGRHGAAGELTRLRICVVDLTEQKRTERQISELTEHNRRDTEQLRINKLEAVGLLAGGIAHDFNNLLTGITGNIALARRDPARADDLLRRADAATHRAALLTQQLLTFARGGEPVKSMLQMGALIQEVAEFSLHGSNVRLELDLSRDLWPVRADRGQLFQVIQNLVTNANEAMESGGRLRITARNLRPGEAGLPELEPGRYVHLMLQDEGVGIGLSEQSRIFDPYFTTKAQGSGLGLATAHSIVRRHGGAMTVVSRPQEGTTMQVYLPAACDMPVAAEAPPRLVSSPVQRRRLLVMDDDNAVRDVIAGYLASLGHEVDTVSDGRAALAAYRGGQAKGRPYDVVILDLTVPGGMGGRETVGALLSLNPQVRCIVASGYSDDAVLSDPARYGFRGVARKPFDVADLSAAIEAALR